MRALCRRRSQYPFRLAGIWLYEALQTVYTKLEELLKTKSHQLPPDFVQVLRDYHTHLYGIVSSQQSSYDCINRQHGYVISIYELLNPKTPQSSQQIQKQVERFWGELAEQAPPEDHYFIKKSLNRHKNWASGLYIRYDFDFLPQTNNHLEQRIKHLKWALRKISGRQYTHDQIIRYGYLSAFTIDLDYQTALQIISKVPYDAYRRIQIDYKKQQEKFRREYRINKDLSKFLDNWIMDMVHND